jgi:hypothetical protein
MSLITRLFPGSYEKIIGIEKGVRKEKAEVTARERASI